MIPTETSDPGVGNGSFPSFWRCPRYVRFSNRPFEVKRFQTIHYLQCRCRSRARYFDPFQMVSTSQRLAKAHVPIEPFAQTLPNLTAMTENLFDLIQSRSLALYPDATMRLAASRAVLVESSRGQRIGKEKQSHHIDVIVALAMACLAAVKGQATPGYDLFAPHLFDDDDDDLKPAPSPVPASMTTEQYERITRPVSMMPREDQSPGVAEAFARARLDLLRKTGNGSS
jgi:hypothetical protein